MEHKANLSTSNEQSVELVYKYIENSLQSTTSSIGGVETRITTLFGFSGLLLRFTLDLPSIILIYGWNVGSFFKMTISIILALAVSVSVFSLFPKASGSLYTAEELLEELEQRDQEYAMQYIALSYDKTLEELDKKRLYKVACLKWIASLILISILLFSLDITLSSFLN